MTVLPATAVASRVDAARATAGPATRSTDAARGAHTAAVSSPGPAVLVDASSPGRVQAARALAAAHGGVVVPVAADGPRRDPYRLRERAPNAPGAAAGRPMVLVVPGRRGPRASVPAPVVGGRVVAFVPADGPEDVAGILGTGTPDGQAPWVVAAMAKDVFLAPTEPWAGTLAAGGRSVRDLRADRARRSDLLDALGSAPTVVLYAGHGRARGWGGYQALRFHHLDALAGAGAGARRPIGLVIAFACDTLARPRGRRAFGVRLVTAGITTAYLGPARSVRTADVRDLADIVVHLLATTRPATAGHLVRAVDDAVAGHDGAARAWRTCRLVGDPRAVVG